MLMYELKHYKEDNMSTTAEFWNKTARKYSLKPVPNQEVYEKKLQKTREYFSADSMVMEFACGTGTTSLLHAPFVKNIDAYDISNEMIKIANEKKDKKSITNVNFSVKSVEEIDFKENYYDMIMGHSILHLTFDNDKILKNAFNSLKKGGVFVTSSGCLKDLSIFLRIILPVLQLLGVAPRLNYFSAKELIELHERTGFQIDHQWHYQKGELFLIAKK